MKKTYKHDVSLNDYMVQALKDWNTNDGREMRDKCPYIDSSIAADTYWLTAYALYHTGKSPRLIHKTRGDSYVIDFPHYGLVRAHVTSKPDQRNGVVFDGRVIL